jgi:hypothetical protein
MFELLVWLKRKIWINLNWYRDRFQARRSTPQVTARCKFRFQREGKQGVTAAYVSIKIITRVQL